MDHLNALPPELFTHIVHQLLRDISELAYAMELRLICKSFRDIIECTIFDGRECALLRCCWSTNSPWEPCESPITQQKELSLCINAINAHKLNRQYILAQMKKPTSSGDRRAAFCQRLQVAARSLTMLRKQIPSILSSASMAMSSLISSSLEVHNDIGQLEAVIVAKVALTVLSRRYYLFTNDKSLPSDFENIPSNYWLLHVACWSGCLQLLDYFEAQRPEPRLLKDSFTDALSWCLPAATIGGSREILNRILSLQCVEILEYRSGLKHSIEAAVSMGDTDTTDVLLGLVSSDRVKEVIIDVLQYAQPKSDRIHGYCNAVSRLLTLIADVRDSDRCMLTNYIACAGGPAGVDVLAQHGLLRPHTPRQRQGSCVTLINLSRKGDALSIRKLFDCKYFDGLLERPEIDRVVATAAEDALDWNHIEVFDELCRHSKYFESREWIAHLAAADGALHHLQNRIRSSRDLHGHIFEEEKEEEYIRPGRATIGQVAIDRALRFLKPLNAKYFLEQGVRPRDTRHGVTVSWSYANRHRADLEILQQTLREYELPLVEVVV